MRWRLIPPLRARLGALLLAGLSGGCGDLYLSAGAFCVSDAGWRVRVLVIDSFGVGVAGARLVYTIDGLGGDAIGCDPAGHCDWVVDRHGLLAISVVSLGYGPGIAHLRLGGDPCRHPAPGVTVRLTRL